MEDYKQKRNNELYQDWVINSNLSIDERKKLLIKFCIDSGYDPIEAIGYLMMKVDNVFQAGFTDYKGTYHDKITEIHILETIKNKVQSNIQIKKLPEELQKDKAKELFEKAIKAGLVEQDENLFIWKGNTKQLLAYFAEKTSLKLNLSLKLDKEGNETINWKVFETTFNVPNLKSAKMDWMKTNTKFTPNGYEKIDAIFD